MENTTEYAVLRRSDGEESIDRDTVTTDIERARRARDVQQTVADYKASRGQASPTTCALVMRTCTPWCEVAEEDPFKKKGGQ